MDRSGRPGVEQLNVLLVGDDSIAFTSDKRRLESRGYHVVKASDADAAIEVARRVHPQAIFLTVDGMGSKHTAFLVALRRDDHTRHIPVTVLVRGDDDAPGHTGLSRVGRDVW